MTNTPIIDPIALQNLRELSPDDNGEFFREIVGIFLADTPIRLAELDECIRSQDGVKLTRTAHSIKGSSANLGAQLLRVAAERLEHTPRGAPASQIEPMVAEIRAQFERAKAELERAVAESTAGGKPA
jgi:HPt (histidine-containing phosphotransfer) domain-containing protein